MSTEQLQPTIHSRYVEIKTNPAFSPILCKGCNVFFRWYWHCNVWCVECEYFVSVRSIILKRKFIQGTCCRVCIQFSTVYAMKNTTSSKQKLTFLSSCWVQKPLIVISASQRLPTLLNAICKIVKLLHQVQRNPHSTVSVQQCCHSSVPDKNTNAGTKLWF